MWKFRRIASGNLARVDMCEDCDAVGISMGAITLRIAD